MFTKKGEHRIEIRTNARDGEGQLTLHHLLSVDELLGKGRLLSKSVLEPGSSVGFHTHQGEMEFFYILSGNADLFDGEKHFYLNSGDTMYTEDGEGHSITAVGENTLEYIALIIYK